MARTFDGTDDDLIVIYATGNTIPITAFPFTLAATAYSNSLTTLQGIFQLGIITGGADYSLAMAFSGNATGDPIIARRYYNGSLYSTPQSAAYSTGVWYRVACVFDSATDTRLYVDNTKYTSSDSIAFPVGADQWFTLAATHRQTDQNWLDGGIQECAAWDISLTDADINSLYKGFSPMRVRPDRLQMYAPCGRDPLTLIVAKGGIAIQNQRGVVADHHRTYGW